MIINVDADNTVEVDSDAKDNLDAMREIDDWAFNNNFSRTNEYHLRVVIREDGTRVFRGVCYRLTPEVRSTARKILEEISTRACDVTKQEEQA